MFSADLLISPGQWRHKLENRDPPRGCACSHQVIEAAQQLDHRDGFRFSLKEKTSKNKPYEQAACKRRTFPVERTLHRLQPIDNPGRKHTQFRKITESVKTLLSLFRFLIFEMTTLKTAFLIKKMLIDQVCAYWALIERDKGARTRGLSPDRSQE